MIGRRTQTHMLNSDAKKCSAYHEAGHAVVGVLGGLLLDYVTARETSAIDPHCKWKKEFIDRMLSNEGEERERFTDRFAEMCLAAEYAEALACDVSSDEQKEACALRLR